MTATTGGRDMAEDSKRLSMADNGASFTYAAPDEEPPFSLGSMAGGSATEDRILDRRAAERARSEERQRAMSSPVATGPLMVPAPDRARIIGTESLADGLRLGQASGGERTFTRTEVIAILKARKAGQAPCPGLHDVEAALDWCITAFSRME